MSQTKIEALETDMAKTGYVVLLSQGWRILKLELWMDLK